MFLDDGQWGADIFIGHAIGCNAVSWAPAVQPGSLIAPQPESLPGQHPTTVQTVRRFASAGCDNLVKIWGFQEDTQTWSEEEILDGHTDWVRDVAWAPNIGLPRSYIATASQVSPEFPYLYFEGKSLRSSLSIQIYMNVCSSIVCVIYRTRLSSSGRRILHLRLGSRPHWTHRSVRIQRQHLERHQANSLM